MKYTISVKQLKLGRLGSLSLGLVLCAVLLGCVSTPNSAPIAKAPVPGATPSPASGSTVDDGESEMRRRARLRLELAASYFDQGQTNVALEELKQVLALDPTYADAYNLRGLIYMRLNDNRQAEESFRRALSLNGGDSATLHNYGWFLCQQGRYAESLQTFSQALANPMYLDRAKTLLAQGLCEARSGDRTKAERSLTRSYELDAANPITGYNLALLLYGRGELTRAQFYVRRLNNSEQANAETLWLGIRIERRLNNIETMRQLGDQLKRRFPQSKEAGRYERGEFDE